MDGQNTFDFHGSGHWAVILGGSSGFGLATAKRLAAAGFNLIVAHRDKAAVVERDLRPAFDYMRAQQVELATHNGNLFEAEEREAFLALVEQRAGAGHVHLLLHSIAAGCCKPVCAQPCSNARRAGVAGLAEALRGQGLSVTEAALQHAVNVAFHEYGRDALHLLAESRMPSAEEAFTEEELVRTMELMGWDYLRWGRLLLGRGLFSNTARLIALTSQGNSLAWRGYAPVSAAKGVLEALCRSMALEMAPWGLRCFLVQAGITDTPAGRGIPQFDLLKAQARLRNPLGRLTQPEDVAAAVYALCLPLLDWVNGCILRVDGGEAISGG